MSSTTIPTNTNTNTNTTTTASTTGSSTSSILGGAATSGDSTSSATQAGGPLGETQFLQLLMTQMKDQDPMNPSDPSQFMSELAQFTSLEQETNVATNTGQLAQEQNASSAIALIGQSVSYKDPTTGATMTGKVASVQITQQGPTLTVGSTAGISLSQVNQVSQ